MATILVSSELTKRSSLYFQQLSTGENNIVRLIEVTAVSKCILSTDREWPKSRPEQRSILSRGHLALFSSESRPPGFSSITPITNQISRPKLEIKSNILLLYLFEATLRAITTIACEEKLAIQLVTNDERSKCCTCRNCWLLQEWCEVLCNWHRRLKAPTICNFLRGQPDGRLFCPLYFLSPCSPLSLPNFPSL